MSVQFLFDDADFYILSLKLNLTRDLSSLKDGQILTAVDIEQRGNSERVIFLGEIPVVDKKKRIRWQNWSINSKTMMKTSIQSIFTEKYVIPLPIGEDVRVPYNEGRSTKSLVLRALEKGKILVVFNG